MPEAMNIYRDLGKGPVKNQVVKFYRKWDDWNTLSAVQIACKSGCTYCCQYHVMVTATEVFAIAEDIAKMPILQRDTLTNRITDTSKRVSKMSADEYIHTNIECALLQNGQCSIYTIRPIACRAHHSTDVSVCKKTHDDVHSHALAPKDYQRELAFRVFDNAQLIANNVLKLDTNKYELHAALAEAISNNISFKRWKSGKSAFPGVNDKVTLKEMMQISET